MQSPRPSLAHDVPSDVTLQMYVHPDGDRLRLLARVPLEALQDTRLPLLGPGYLDFEAMRQSSVLQDAAMIWVGENIELFEEGERLPPLDLNAVRISLPSNRAFSSYDTALGHTTGDLLPSSTQLIWQQAMLDVALETPIQSASSNFSIRPRHARLGMRVVTALRFVTPEGKVRAFEYRGEPGLVRLDPRWHQAARRFIELGFFHILDGIDHLLFLACLVIPLRRLRQLVIVVTSFTVAHSITLIAAAYGLAPDALWFPAMVEMLIALSIVYMAFENIIGARVERRWLITFAFGLVHGFGFSFVLSETMQFAGSHLLLSLLSFNVGVELGQLFVLVLLVPALDLLFKHAVKERLGTILLSALIAHSSWHWMSERAQTLGQYPIDWPLVRLVPTSVLPWLAPVVILAGLAWRAVHKLRQPQGDRSSARPLPDRAPETGS